MQKIIPIYVFIVLIFLSCQDGKKKIDVEAQKAKIQLNGLSDKHPNKMQMVSLLNNYKEEFLECNSDLGSLKKQFLIQKQFSFRTKQSNVLVFLLFCKKQNDAITIAESNFVNANESTKCGVNGATLFVVKGKDKYEVNNILSHFAGEE
ncbi:MAG: hypothetical protein C0594_06195 [Marinilabiliales bacterium]|nr:MAG: hypothetical protein C0594_06195 [Marinilabiliales bacterium]